MSNFFEELKRRNVYKVATAYVVTSWLIIQVVNTIGPNLNFPDSVPALITRILIVGFPIALILAWIYELTPQGFKRTGAIQVDTSDNRKAGKKLNRVIIVSLALIVTLMLVERLFFRAPLLNKDQQLASIAVLPFVNMSSNEENEFFADGLAEQILDELAQLSGLQVTARTSSFAFKGKNADMRTIGKELAVNYLLEGSVRFDEKSNRIKITTQLINTANGYHLWSKTYDEDFDAIFDIQEDVGRAVASELKVRLLPQEEELLASKMTENTEAYKLYVESRQYSVKRNDEDLDKAIELLKEAIELDPNFAEAHAELSFLYGQKHFYGNLNQNDRDELMEYHVQKAMELGPDKAEVLRAKAINDNRLGRDSSQVIADLRRAIELKPNYADAHFMLFSALNWANQPDLSLKSIEKAYELDPLGHYNYMLAQAYFMRGYQEKGMKMVDQAISRDSSSYGFYMLKSRFLRMPPRGDDVGAFKLVHHVLTKEKFQIGAMGHLIRYSLNLDLAPLAEKYMKIYQIKRPDNPHTLTRSLEVNSFLGKYKENLELVELWSEEKGMDKADKALELAYAYFDLDNYGEAESQLRNGFPELFNEVDVLTEGSELTIDWSNRYALSAYIGILRRKENSSQADLLADRLCEFYELHGRPNFMAQAEYELDCLQSKNDGNGLANKLNDLFFIEKNRLQDIFLGIKSGWYKEFYDNDNFLSVKRKITDETHRMRAEVIEYLKEAGDWDPAWDKELGLE